MPEQNRVALVIGNADYEYAAPLHNPFEDAVKVGDALRRLGFKVKVATNCTKNDFQKELRLFSNRLPSADAALFYYSGHAVQYEGENYLIPVDALLEAPEDLEPLACRVAPRLEAMRRRARVSLVFLDACRDDPFKLELMGPKAGTKGGIVRRVGLREVADDELKDALIAFAAEQGTTAADGEEGSLSPFTQALLQHLETPDLEVTEMMRRVKKSVREATKGKQTPWSNDSMTTPFYFKPGSITQPPSSPQPPAPELIEGPREIGSSDDKILSRHDKPNLVSTLWDHLRSITEFNLAARLETTGRSAGPLLLGGLSITVAFVLMLLSQILDLALVTYPTKDGLKQIGFISAPNWTVVYAVLFPIYLCLFAILTDRCKITLTSLLQKEVIMGPKGNLISEPALFAAWNRSLQRVSLLLWGLMVVIVIQTGAEWFSTCLRPYFGGPLAGLDWSTVAAKGGDELQKVKSITFSAIAYLYMAIALYIYLAILVYAAAFCFFLNSLADPTGEFRLVLRDATFGKRFSDIGNIIYWCAVLGLGAGFMMRLEAIYLETNYLFVTDLLFSDLLSWTGRLRTNAGERIADAFYVPSSWTGLLEIMFTLLILFAVVFLLYNTFEKAMQYYMDNIDNEDWRQNMRIDHSKKEVAAIRRQAFLSTVFPMFVHFCVIIAGVVLCGIFIGYGSIALATLIYAVVVFVVVAGLKASTEHDLERPDDGPTRPNQHRQRHERGSF
jgi:hypothetical protein